MHYDGVNSYLFVNSVKIYKFKAKDSGINVVPLWLGKVSNDFSFDNMKKTRLYRWFYDFFSLWFFIWLWYYWYWWHFGYSLIFNEKAWYKIVWIYQ